MVAAVGHWQDSTEEEWLRGREDKELLNDSMWACACWFSVTLESKAEGLGLLPGCLRKSPFKPRAISLLSLTS